MSGAMEDEIKRWTPFLLRSDIRMVKELLGHKDVGATMVYIDLHPCAEPRPRRAEPPRPALRGPESLSRARRRRAVAPALPAGPCPGPVLGPTRCR